MENIEDCFHESQIEEFIAGEWLVVSKLMKTSNNIDRISRKLQIDETNAIYNRSKELRRGAGLD